MGVKVFFLILIFGFKIYAVGLSTTFVEVLVKDIEIGKTYNISQICNYPYSVSNTGPSTIYVEVTPTKAFTKKEGYEHIPQPSWVRIEPSLLEVPPHQNATASIIISLPEDESLLGKKYVVGIWAKVVQSPSGGVGIGPAILSRLLIEVSDKYTPDFSISPQKIIFEGLLEDQTYTTTLVIHNKSNKDLFFEIEKEDFKDELKINAKAKESIHIPFRKKEEIEVNVRPKGYQGVQRLQIICK